MTRSPSTSARMSNPDWTAGTCTGTLRFWGGLTSVFASDMLVGGGDGVEAVFSGLSRNRLRGSCAAGGFGAIISGWSGTGGRAGLGGGGGSTGLTGAGASGASTLANGVADPDTICARERERFMYFWTRVDSMRFSNSQEEGGAESPTSSPSRLWKASSSACSQWNSGKTRTSLVFSRHSAELVHQVTGFFVSCRGGSQQTLSAVTGRPWKARN